MSGLSMKLFDKEISDCLLTVGGFCTFLAVCFRSAEALERYECCSIPKSFKARCLKSLCIIFKDADSKMTTR